MKGFALILGLVGLMVVCILTAQAQPICLASDANRAEVQVPVARDWQALYAAYRRFPGCDDGAIAEGYSDVVARLLAGQWETMPRFVRLARKDPAFGDFVLRHLDETMSSEHAEAIKYNVSHQCPVGSLPLCQRISRHLGHLRFDNQ